MKDFVQKYRINKLIKALRNKSFEAITPDVAKATPTISYNKGTPSISGPKLGASSTGASGGKDRGFPIGTVRNGRMKVSANPSKWIDQKNGSSHKDETSGKAHSLEDHTQVIDFFHKVTSKMKLTMSSEDASKASDLLRNYLDKKIAAKNLMKTANTESSATQGAPTSTDKNTYFQASQKAEEAKTALMRHIQSTKKSPKGGDK